MRQTTDSEKRVIRIIGATLCAVTVFSTILHHFFPWVLKVPPNTGVPYTGYAQMFLMDLIPITMGWLCFYHSWKKQGLYTAMMFLGGSFFFSGIAENAWVLLGRNHVFAHISDSFKDVAGTYYFTRGFFWWGEMPVIICLCWYFIAYACVEIARVLLPGSNMAVKAALGGFLAMSFDLWVDPVQVHPAWQSWKWLSNETLKVFSIPLSNFPGWFLFIFLFAIGIDKLPRLVEKWGVGKGSGMFFLMLIAFKICMLAVLMTYGAIAMKYVSPPVNLTLWGI